MCDRFRDTCCGKTNTWLSTLTTYPNIFDPEAAPDEEAKAKNYEKYFFGTLAIKRQNTPGSLHGMAEFKI